MQKAVTADSPSEPLRRIRIPFIHRGRLIHDGVKEELFLVDLGLAGAFVERQSPLPIGERVTLRFSLPGNDRPMTAACRVAWWHPPGGALVSKSLPAGLGLEFLEISEEDEARLKRYLREYLDGEPQGRRFHRSWPLSGEGGEP